MQNVATRYGISLFDGCTYDFFAENEITSNTGKENSVMVGVPVKCVKENTEYKL